MNAEVGTRWGLMVNCDVEESGERFVYRSESVGRVTLNLDVGCDVLPGVTGVEGRAACQLNQKMKCGYKNIPYPDLLQVLSGDVPVLSYAVPCVVPG